MNLPPPPTYRAYNETVKVLSSVTTDLAEECMNSAAEEVKSKKGNECGVSVDGTWQRRGFSSLSGVVAAVSVDTGKVLDVEILSRSCAGCKKHNKDHKTSYSYLAWQGDHAAVCKKNYPGSAPNMEPEGAKKIFSVPNKQEV